MKVHIITLKGLRDQNEDEHSVILNGDNKDCTMNSVNFFGVYDGHGGKQVSKFLANNLPYYFMKKKIKYPISKTYVKKVYDHVQSLLRNKYKNFSYTTGSTCLVVAHYKKNSQYYIDVMNTGDSRCVLCRDNIALPLTKDHKPIWPEEKRRIEQLGGKLYYDGDWRIKNLSVSKAFGDIEAAPFVTHRPDIFHYKLDKSDKFLILACDGLWDVLDNNEAINFVLENCYDEKFEKTNDKVNIAQKLAEHALRKGSMDNITVVVVFLK